MSEPSGRCLLELFQQLFLSQFQVLGQVDSSDIAILCNRLNNCCQ